MPDWVSLFAFISLLSFLPVAAYIFYSGLLSEITVLTGSPPIKKITFAYKFKQGPYKSCGKLFKESHSVGPKLSCIGVFYDDPKKVPGSQCRCAVGSILSEGENKPDEELLKRYETLGFNVFSFPEVTHVVSTSFPHRTFLSVLLSVRRVYPQLEHYIKERRLCAHPFLEIYREGQIQFMAPLARQGDFYVPEVRQVERRFSEQEESHSDSEVSGADSNSEYSSGSGVLLSDSREMSPVASWVQCAPTQDQGERDCRERSWRRSLVKELDWDQTGAQQEERGEQLHGDSNHKSLEVPTVEWWGVVGEEE
ncbi:testis-expressed protein 264 isoform X1 [Mastacembelus armatus]|uniref:Testis expressed 264, ER-phagy receptor n=1 Tax=Mastacembelus armatus TaxID=205130 RepID=A0A3Q3N0X9_9TELE|nr:testis-expressed protein 264-like isoform X1 [Mastacembelus armatus]